MFLLEIIPAHHNQSPGHTHRTRAGSNGWTRRGRGVAGVPLVPMSSARLARVLAFAAISCSVIAQSASPNILIVYHTETKHTRALAEAIADGAKKTSANVKCQSITDTSVEEDVLDWADAFILGSPVHYGNPSSNVLAWFETDWVHFWTDPRLENKVGAVFATGGGLAQGLEHVLSGLQRLLESFRIQVLTPSPTGSAYSSYGAVAVTGTPPFNASEGVADVFADAGRTLGAFVAAKARLQSTVGFPSSIV